MDAFNYLDTPMLLRLLLVNICCMLMCLAHAQTQYRFVGFNTKDGLSQNSVHCIFQDRDGLLWIGTQDGLNSFDGRKFRVYKCNPKDTTTISDQFVLSIEEDALGFLWVGTRSGLNKLDKRTGKFIRYYFSAEERTGLYRNYQTVIRDRQGNLFVQHTYPVFINTKGQMIKADTALQTLRSPVFDQEGNLWGSSFKKGILCANRQSQYQLQAASLFPDSLKGKNGVMRHLMDNASVLWCYTDENQPRIHFFNTRTRKWLDKTVSLPSPIQHVTILRNGQAWVSTMTGVFVIQGYTVTDNIAYQPSLQSIPSANILCAYEDRQANIWVGSANAGFAYHNPSFRNFILYKTGLQEEPVTSVADLGGFRWIGTANGLYKTSLDVKQQQATKLFGANRVTSLTVDKQSKLWVAIQRKGVYVLDSTGRSLQAFTQNDSILQAQTVLYLFCDASGRVFLATEKGFFVYQPSKKQWQSFYEFRKNHVAGWYSLHVFEDAQQQIWISKHIGLEKRNSDLSLKQVYRSKNVADIFGRTIITAVTEDKAGRIWIATLSNGIFCIDESRVLHYTMEEGLSSNLIYGIAVDQKSRVWATTSAGINLIDRNKRTIDLISSKDGLPSDDFVIGALYTNKSGEILAGSVRGLIGIDANQFSLQDSPVEATIAEVSLNGEPQAMNQGLVEIRPGYKSVRFAFALRQALQPKAILYQYRLKGVEERWQSLKSDESSITYSNLPAGKMVLEVRAAYTMAGLTKAPVASLNLEVFPAFWQTRTFVVLIVAVLIFTAVLITLQYNRIRYKKKLQALQLQKELQDERARISRDLHDNIGAYTSALIAGIHQLKSVEAVQEAYVDELHDYASNIMGYLRETIWVLNHEQLTLTAFIDRFKTYATRINKYYRHQELQFTTAIQEERVLTPQISLNLFRVLQEALQNACKHAGATRIHIHFMQDKQMKFMIEDNGKGFEPDRIDQGFGLQNMQARANEIGFRFSIASKDQEGTVILLEEST